LLLLAVEPKYNRKFCERLAQTISTETDVPQQCRDFDTVMIMVRRRESKRSAQAVAFEGMTPAEAASAIAARERGHLNPMQIQRRMTNRKSNRVW
jgi:hypothetical protein